MGGSTRPIRQKGSPTCNRLHRHHHRRPSRNGVPIPCGSRWTTRTAISTGCPRFFRLIWAIPILILLGTVSGGTWQSTTDTGNTTTTIVIAAGGLLFMAPLLMILFRQKYPRWWFDWNLELLRFTNRVSAYLALMDDRYPSADETQSVHLDAEYPDAAHGLNRWMPLVKWFLAIPHYFVLIFLWIAAFFVVIIAWFAILFTGRYPAGLERSSPPRGVVHPGEPTPRGGA